MSAEWTQVGTKRNEKKEMRMMINPKHRVSPSASIADPERWLRAEGAAEAECVSAEPDMAVVQLRLIYLKWSSVVTFLVNGINHEDISEQWDFTEDFTGSLRISIASHTTRNALLPPPTLLLLVSYSRCNTVVGEVHGSHNEDAYQTGVSKLGIEKRSYGKRTGTERTNSITELLHRRQTTW